MLLGLDTSSYQLAAGLGEWRPQHSPLMRLEYFFRKAAELCLQGVSISDLRLLERADYGYLSSLRRAAEQDGLFLQLTYTGFRSDHLQDTVRVAGALGCKSLSFRPLFERPLSEQSMRIRLQEVADLLAQALPVAERYSVGIALAGGGVLTSEEIFNLCEATEGELLTLCLDPASALCVLEDPVDWAQELAPNASCVQISDYQLVSDPAGARLFSCALGDGIVNITGMLEVLRRASPEAYLLLATPGESISLPMLDNVFLERLHHLRPAQLARMVQLLRERGLESPPSAPQGPALPEDEILAAEEERFQQSLEWLRSHLAEEESAGE